MHVNYADFASFLLLPNRCDVMDMINALFDCELRLLDQITYLMKVISFDNSFDLKMEILFFQCFNP